MPTALVAHQKPISRIFSDDYVFSIPGYQRPYAWTTEQARDLFEDLTTSINARPVEIDEIPPYFLGSIVLIKAEEHPEADVVDGQQRLTTLTLLLSAIRSNVSPKNASEITGLLYEQGSEIHDTRDRFRLTLRERDREFFQQYVQREGGFAKLLTLHDLVSDSQRNIRDNAIEFDRVIKKLPEVARVQLAKFIVTRCYLVVVATPDIDSAYRIFSVLNTRGLDLSATDILKAQVLGGIKALDRNSYTKKWEDTEEALGRDAFGDLFGHIRMIYRKAKPHGTLLAEFKEHVTKRTDPARFIDEVLRPMAIVYEEIADGTYANTENAAAINDFFKWLNRLEFNDWVPSAIAFSIRYRSDSTAMERFFRDLERLAYGLLIMRRGINDRIDRFSRLTKAIEAGDELFNAPSPLQLSPAEQFIIYAALAGPVYENFAARVRSTILLRLDGLLSGGGAIYDYETITVEHVLPQTPAENSEWLSWFPDPQSRLDHVHTLGNLALLTRKKNSSASNYDFATKKEAYFTRGGISPFVLTTQVLVHSSWTEEVILQRQQVLLSALEQHWRLQDREDPQLLKEAGAAYEGDGTWRDDVHEALRRLGGRAALARIYTEVEAIRRGANRSTPRSLEAVIRRTLEENSADSSSFKSQHNLFSMPEGRGAGIWALR